MQAVAHVIVREWPPRGDENRHASVCQRQCVKRERRPEQESDAAAAGEACHATSQQGQCEPDSAQPTGLGYIQLRCFQEIRTGCPQISFCWIYSRGLLRDRFCGVWSIRELERIAIDGGVIGQPQDRRGGGDQRNLAICVCEGTMADCETSFLSLDCLRRWKYIGSTATASTAVRNHPS